MKSGLQKPVAFTVMELLVTCAVVAVLGVLLFGGLRSVRQQGLGAKCMGNLRQIGAATAAYLAENRGFLPLALEKNLISGGSAWDGDHFGAWYWQLAPYLGVERWTSVHKYLGPQGRHIYEPIVFTCPAHGKAEPMPISYPSVRPVSYAPSTRLSPTEVTTAYETHEVRRLNVSEIKHLPGKVWVSDSTHPGILNISAKRWQLETPDYEAWARLSFTRHGGAGNALFFDGHVERIPYRSIAGSNLANHLNQWFDPDF